MNKQGFSIIEVLIVLAIAGLIMLVVFLAVPALRRNAANSGRQNDASRISSTVTDCLANRNGVIASCTTTAQLDFGTLSQLDNSTVTAGGATTWNNITVSTANPPVAAALAAPASDTNAIKVQITYYAKCNTDGSGATASVNSRDFAVLYNKATSGGVTPQCIGS